MSTNIASEPPASTARIRVRIIPLPYYQDKYYAPSGVHYTCFDLGGQTPK